MPVVRWLRRHVALYTLLLLYPLTYLVLRGNFANSDRSWDGAAAGAAGTIIIIAPLGAALAAWEAHRLRRGGMLNGAHVRSRLTVAGSFLWPVFGACGSALAMAAALAWIEMSSAPGWWNPLIFLVPTVVVVAFVMLGFSLGLRFPPVWTVPLLLIGGWFALAYPVALEPLWLRHLTGELSQNCCEVGQRPNPRALLAPVMVAAGMIGAAILLLPRERMDRLWSVLAVVVLAGGLGSGTMVVKGLGWDGGLPRTSGLVCGREAEIEICLWQEHEPYRKRFSGALVTAAHRLATAGLPAPRTISEGDSRTAGTWNLYLARRSGPTDAVMSMISGLMPPEPACASSGEWLGEPAVNSAGAWAALTAGAPSDLIAERIGADALRTARKVLAAPRDRQLTWFRQTLRAASRCDVVPPKAPRR